MQRFGQMNNIFAFLTERPLAIKSITSGMRGEFILYAGSTAAVQASKLITMLMVANVLGPTTTGWWNSLQPIYVYGTMLHFGVLNGMNRDVPYFNGKGLAERAEYVRRVSWGIALQSAVLSCMLAVAASFFVRDNPLVSGALQMLGIALIFQQWYLYEAMVTISAIRFKLFSLYQIFQAVTFPLLTLPPAHFWGLNGFILGQAAVNVLVCVLMTWLGHYNLRPIFDWKEARRLAGVGFPILTAGFFFDMLRSLDRWVILSLLGPVQVGYYTLSILALQSVTLLPSLITAQFYPRMAKRFGESNSYEAILPLINKSLLGAAGLILPFGLVVMLFVRPFTLRFMPQYVQGISSALIVTLGVTVSIPLAGVSATFLNAVGKAHWYMLASLVTIGVQVALTIVAVQLGWGLAGVAWGVTIAQMVNMVILVVMAYYLLKLKKVPVE